MTILNTFVSTSSGPDAMETLNDLLNGGRTFGKAATASGVMATGQRLIANRGGLLGASRNLANTTSTQVGDQMNIQIMQDASDISFRLGNFAATGVAATDLSGLSAVTWRGGIFDGVTYYPVFGSNGSRDIIIQPGAIVDTAPVPLLLKKGQSIALITLKTWTTAPAYFPGSPIPSGGARDLSEAGTALTDRTLSGGFAANTRLGLYAIMPPLAVLGTGAKRICDAVLGDSIGSEGVSDITTGRGEYGYMQRGLAAAGIPSITLGQANLRASDVVANNRVLGQYLASCLRIGISHIAIALATNDFTIGRTATQIYTDYLRIRDFAAPLGIKVVIVTAPPKTNAANNAQNGSETTTWAQRRTLNDTIRDNKGLGDGFLDLAAVWQDPANIDLWRTDILGLSTFTIADGGMNYIAGDLVEMANGSIIAINTVGANGVTTAAVIKFGTSIGGFLAAPSGPVLAQNAQNFGTVWPVVPGSGLSITVTGTSSAVATTDGVHGTGAAHAFAMQATRDQAATVFA